MKHHAFIALAAITLAACEQPPTAVSPVRAPSFLSTNSATTSISNITFPIELFVFVPCANGGAGEVIDVSGPLHEVFRLTQSSSGNFSLYIHDQPQGVSGVGLTTGAKYQATGITEQSFHFNGLPFNTTFVNNFNMIGQGPGNNFKVHENFHLTVNANGVLTAFVDNFSITCN